MPSSLELQQALNLIQAFAKTAPEFATKWSQILPTLDDNKFQKALALIKSEKQKLWQSLGKINQQHLQKLNEFTRKEIAQAFVTAEIKTSTQEKQNTDHLLSELS